MLKRIAGFARNVRAIPSNVARIPLLLAQSDNVEQRIVALDKAIRALQPTPVVATAKSGSYDDLAEHLRHVLAHPVAIESVECSCCKAPIVFAEANRRVADCMFPASRWNATSVSNAA